MGAAPKHRDFDLASMSELLGPCQHCVEHCTQDRNNFCAIIVSSSSRQCSRCQELCLTNQQGECVPFAGAHKEMKAFLDIRDTVRRHPNDVGAQKAFVILGQLLRTAISGRTNTETLEDGGDDKEDLALRLAVLETQLQTACGQVSLLKLRVSSSNRVNTPRQTSTLSPVSDKTSSTAVGNIIDLTRLGTEEAEPDGAQKTANLQTHRPRILKTNSKRGRESKATRVRQSSLSLASGSSHKINKGPASSKRRKASK